MAVLALLCLLGCGQEHRDTEDIQIARDAYTSGHFTEAERIYERYLQERPKGRYRWEAWSRLLDIARNVLDDREKAATLLDAMVLEYADDSRRSWDLLSQLAEVHEGLRRWDDAIEAWQRCLNLPNLDEAHIPVIHLRLACIYQRLHEYDLAQDALNTCAEKARDPQIKGQCLYVLAQTLGYTERLEDAKQVLRQLVELQGLDSERKALGVFLLADACEQQGQVAEAKRLFTSILNTYPNPKVVQTRLDFLEKSGKK